MRIRMLRNQLGSMDHLTSILYEAGQEYETPNQISEDLVDAFVTHMRCAEIVEEVAAVQPPENKVVAPPEVKTPGNGKRRGK